MNITELEKKLNFKPIQPTHFFGKEFFYYRRLEFSNAFIKFYSKKSSDALGESERKLYGRLELISSAEFEVVNEANLTNEQHRKAYFYFLKIMLSLIKCSKRNRSPTIIEDLEDIRQTIVLPEYRLSKYSTSFNH